MTAPMPPRPPRKSAPKFPAKTPRRPNAAPAAMPPAGPGAGAWPPVRPSAKSVATGPDQPAAPPLMGEAEIDALQALIDRLPPDRDALDATMIDGYLCGVLLQPRPIPEAAWLALVTDLDGRAPPANFPMAELRALVTRRHAELNRAIHLREWFDPWVYVGDEEDGPSETVLPWVAGFAAAVDHFTELMDRHEDVLLEPLAVMYRHLDPADLEDADELLAEIETYEPAATVDEAVEDLVRSVLLMADVSRPQTTAGPARRGRPGAGHGAARKGPPGPPRGPRR